MSRSLVGDSPVSHGWRSMKPSLCRRPPLRHLRGIPRSIPGMMCLMRPCSRRDETRQRRRTSGVTYSNIMCIQLHRSAIAEDIPLRQYCDRKQRVHLSGSCITCVVHVSHGARHVSRWAAHLVSQYFPWGRVGRPMGHPLAVPDVRSVNQENTTLSPHTPESGGKVLACRSGLMC